MSLILNSLNNNISIVKSKNVIYTYIYEDIYNYTVMCYSIKRLRSLSRKFFRFKFHFSKINKYSTHTSGFKHLPSFEKQFQIYFTAKIKFTGKGYKIRKWNSQGLNLIFNRAHPTRFYYRNLFLYKLKKYKLYFRLSSMYCAVPKKLIKIRFVNIFTKRGLRLSKQILKKKKG